MIEYSVPLALEDYLPVLLSGVGLALIVRLIAARRPAMAGWAALGAAFVVAGGLSRATWKLIVALGGVDVGELYVLLFPSLVAGYLLLGRVAWGMHDREASGPARPWLAAALGLAGLGIVTWLAGPQEGRLVPLAWLGVATLGSGVFNVALARWALSLGRSRIALLFVVSLAVTIALNGVARSAQASEAIQWLQQGINTGNQLLFLFAAQRLARAQRSEGSADRPAAAVPSRTGD